MIRFPAILVIAMLFTVSLAIANPSLSFSSLEYHSGLLFAHDQIPTRMADEHGIKELVPADYLPRFQKWKNDLLATEYGRTLWESYASRKDFLLTIKVVGNRKFGAGTDDFEWDENGRLIAATITLGKNLDHGFPDPVYYPVMNSLASLSSIYAVGEGVLASTKMAHEIGHVSFTADANSSLFRKQNRLMDSYYKIFLKNGFNTKDARLVSLANELGAQPIEIWENREYWSEVSALKYLVERIDKENVYSAVMNKVKQNVANHAQNYRERFEISKIGVRSSCGN